VYGILAYPGPGGLTPGYDVNALPEAAPFGEATASHDLGPHSWIPVSTWGNLNMGVEHLAMTNSWIITGSKW